MSKPGGPVRPFTAVELIKRLTELVEKHGNHVVAMDGDNAPVLGVGYVPESWRSMQRDHPNGTMKMINPARMASGPAFEVWG